MRTAGLIFLLLAFVIFCIAGGMSLSNLYVYSNEGIEWWYPWASVTSLFEILPWLLIAGAFCWGLGYVKGVEH